MGMPKAAQNSQQSKYGRSKFKGLMWKAAFENFIKSVVKYGIWRKFGGKRI